MRSWRSPVFGVQSAPAGHRPAAWRPWALVHRIESLGRRQICGESRRRLLEAFCALSACSAGRGEDPILFTAHPAASVSVSACRSNTARRFYSDRVSGDEFARVLERQAETETDAAGGLWNKIAVLYRDG